MVSTLPTNNEGIPIIPPYSDRVPIVPPYTDNPIAKEIIENLPEEEATETESTSSYLEFLTDSVSTPFYKLVKVTVLDQSFTFGDERLRSLQVSLGANEKTSTIQAEIVDADLSVSDAFFKFSRANGGIKLPKEFGTQQAQTGTETATTGGAVNLADIPNGLTGDDLARVIVQYAKADGVTNDQQIAYILATAEHESLMGEALSEWGGESARYAPYFGRGIVQLTWKENYQTWSDKLGVDFVSQPDLVKELKYAVPILVQGMRDGSFTGVGLSDFTSGNTVDYVGARAIVNGSDRASDIAGLAARWESRISELSGGYAAPETTETTESKEIAEPIASTVGNEILLKLVSVNDKQYTFKFILTGTSVNSLPCANFTFSGKAIKYSLSVEDKTENFENVTVSEYVSIIGARYGITINDTSSNAKRFRYDVIEQRNENDLDTLLKIAKDQSVDIIDDPQNDAIEIRDEDKKKTPKNIIVSDLIDIDFTDEGVVDVEPQYPVNLTVFTTDEILSLKPEDSISLNNIYSFVPDSLKVDTWVINTIAHDIANETTRIQLQKYIPKDAVSTGNGGTLSESEILAKYANSVVKVGSASGAFVSEDGFILTAGHMSGTTDIETKDGQKFTAKQIEIDNNHDLMLMKIDGNFTPIPLAPDESIYRGGDKVAITKIGHGVTTEGGKTGTEGGTGEQKFWDATTTTVIKIEENGYRNLQGEVVVADDDTVDFVNAGDSGCPWIDPYGLIVSVTSAGDKSKYEGGGKGGTAWGSGVKHILELLDRNSVKYMKGTRAIEMSNTSGGTSTGGAGVYPGWALPSDGVLTSDFGNRNAPTGGASRNHKGWDIAAGSGSPIYAASSGKVIDWDNDTNGSGYGRYIVIAHDDPSDVWTLYGHCQQLLVNLGDRVSMRQQIALEDSTGISTGSHLHFECRRGASGNNIWSGTAINPREFLPVPPSTFSLFDTQRFSICVVDLSDKNV